MVTNPSNLAIVAYVYRAKPVRRVYISIYNRLTIRVTAGELLFFTRL
jgi:hypothetical protein